MQSGDSFAKYVFEDIRLSFFKLFSRFQLENNRLLEWLFEDLH